MTKEQTLLYIAVAVALVLSLATLLQSNELVVTEQGGETITVQGEAEQFVTPDTASVSFTMTRKSKDLEEARSSVDDRIKDFLKSVKSDGIEDKDIRTTNYSVNPQYNYTERQQVFDGYRVSQTIELKIRDLDNVGEVLGKIGELEVDNVSQLTFSVEDDEDILDGVREDAIDDAQKKARNLARDLGVNLEKIVSFSENQDQYYPQPYFNRAYSEDFAQSDSVAASIPVGENKFQKTVTITYKISN